MEDEKMEKHPDMRDLVEYVDYSLCKKRHEKIHGHIVGCVLCQDRLAQINLVHPGVKELINFISGKIKNRRTYERINYHINLRKCFLCNRWLDKLRLIGQQKISRKRLSALEKEFSSEASLLSVLPSASSGTFRRYCEFEFCQRLRRDGDQELDPWVQRIRRVIKKL